MNLKIPNLARAKLLQIVTFAIAGLLITVWLVKTPPGLLGKADAVGYAVCHQISERSFFIGDRDTPLCARCSGMYLGALLGIFYTNRMGRRGGLPSSKINIVLGLFFLAFALDGGNSYLHFFPNAPELYQPHNLLRLITGTGIGIGIAAFLTPVFHQSVWRQFNPEPALSSWQQFIPLLILAGILDGMIWSENLLLLYPLALLSSIGVLTVLTMVHTIVWIMLLKQENSFDSMKEIWFPLLVGFTTAFLQIALVDFGRYWFTGTWDGFNF